MGALILDASVLIGLLDTADAHHERAVSDVEAGDRARRELIVPASAYSEALVAFARAGRLADARAAIAAIGIEIAPLTAAMADEPPPSRPKRALRDGRPYAAVRAEHEDAPLAPRTGHRDDAGVERRSPAAVQLPHGSPAVA